MTSIFCHGNYAQLVDATAEALSVAKTTLRYRQKGYQYAPSFQNKHWDGYVKLISTRNVFPRGLISVLTSAFDKNGIEYTIDDDEVPQYVPYDESVLINISLCRVGKNEKIHDYQVKAVQAILQNRRGVLQMATNAGKTEVSIAAAKMFHHHTGKNVLFLTHRKQLARQTTRRFHKEFDKVGFIGEGEWNPEPGVTIGMVSTIMYKNNLELSKELLREFFDGGMVIIDECHHAPSDQWYDLVMSCNAQYRIGMSGTPLMRTDGANLKLIAATGPVITKVTNRELIDWGFSVEPIMFYTTVKKPYIFRYPYRAAYTKGIVENETRNEEIVRWVASFRRYGLQVLVLFWEAEHGASIYNALVGGGFDRSKIRVIFGTKTNYDFMLNKIKDREKAIVEFQSGNVNILVASGILDEGMDLDSIDAMIMAGGHKAPIRILQRVGRAVRLSKSGLPVVFVVDFADFTNKKLLQHSLERYKHCKREGFRQIKMNPGDFRFDDHVPAELGNRSVQGVLV